MQLTIINGSNDKVFHFRILPKHKKIAMTFIVATLAVCFLSGFAVKEAYTEFEVSNLIEQVNEQNDKLDEIEAQALAETNALTQLVSRIQYDLNMANAMGRSLSNTLNIEADEFDFQPISLTEPILSENIRTLRDRSNATVAQLEVISSLVEEQTQYTASLPEIRGRINSSYGMRRHPVTGEVRAHQGVDIAKPNGSPIYAPAQGMVIFSGWRDDYGNVVEIDHGNGYTTLYAHNSENMSQVGDIVDRNTMIARVGSTGLSTGPHMHVEVRRNGNLVNPIAYVN